MSGGPKSCIIFPDQHLVGERNIVSVTPEPGGSYVGNTFSESDVKGSLIATMDGRFVNPAGQILTLDEKHFDLRVQQAGGQTIGSWAHRPQKTDTTVSASSSEVGSFEIVDGGDIILNGISIGRTRGLDSLTTTAGSPATSALAKIIAINLKRDEHQVTASPFPMSIKFGAVIGGGTLPSGRCLLGGLDILNGTGPVSFLPGDTSGALQAAINAETAFHGIEASLFGIPPLSGLTLTLTESAKLNTGQTLQLLVHPSATAMLGWTGTTFSFHVGGITLTSDTHVDLRGSTELVLVLGADMPAYTTNTHLYGYNDQRYMQYTSRGRISTTDGLGASSAFCPRYNRELNYTAVGTSGGVASIFIGHHKVDDKPDDWAQVTITFPEDDFYDIGNGVSGADFMKVCTTSDGTLRMVSKTKEEDINVWYSEDGLDWQLLSPNIIGMGGLVKALALTDPQFDSSGDYLRLSFLDGLTLRTLVSADGGGSWLEPAWTNLIAGTDILANADLVDPYIWCMAGLGDEPGTFLLLFQDDSTSKFQRAFIASGTSAWAETGRKDHISTTSGYWYKSRMSAVRGADYFYIFYTYDSDDTINNPWHRPGMAFVIWIVDPNNPLTKGTAMSTFWPSFNFVGGWQGVTRFCPARVNMTFCGKYISMFGGLVDYNPGGALGPAANLQDDKTFYWRFGDWSLRPIGNSGLYQPQNLNGVGTVEDDPYVLLAVGWQVPTGQPAPAGNGNVALTSPWTRTRSGTTSNYSSTRLRLTDTATPALGEHYIFELNDTANVVLGAPIWISSSESAVSGAENNACVIEMVCKQVLGYPDSTLGSSAPTGFRLDSVITGFHLNIGVYVSASEVVVEDMNGGGAGIDVKVGTCTLDAVTSYVIIRLALRVVNTADPGLAAVYETRGVLSCKRYGRYDASVTGLWITSNEFTLNPVAVIDADRQLLEFGQFNFGLAPGGIQRQHSWKSIQVMIGNKDGDTTVLGQYFAGDLETQWPERLRGHLVTSNPVQMGYGITARWGGAAGFHADYYNGPQQYSYSATNIALGSPRLAYRSLLDEMKVSTETFEIIVVADPDNPAAKFNFNAIAAFNTNIGDITVYGTDDLAKGFTTLSATPYRTYLERIRIPDLITVVGPHTIRITLAGGGAHPAFLGEFDASQGLTYRVRLTSIGVDTETYPILNTIPWESGGAKGYDIVVKSDYNLIYTGTSYNEVAIYSDRWLFRTAADVIKTFRYIKITGNNELRVTSENYLTLGTLIIGIQKNLDVPLEWVISNNEQPNITNYRTKGALAWSFVEGPPQRTITGTVVGDVSDEERQSLRQLLRSQTQYEHKPVVLVLNKDKQGLGDLDVLFNPENVILGRVTSGTDLSNAAWYIKTKTNVTIETQMWRQAGNLKIVIEEEV